MSMAIENFTVVCAWCNRILSDDVDYHECHEKRFTHSICEGCLEQIKNEIADLQAHIESKKKEKVTS